MLADANVRNWNAEMLEFFEEQTKGCENLKQQQWKYYSSVAHQFLDTGNNQLYYELPVNHIISNSIC